MNESTAALPIDAIHARLNAIRGQIGAAFHGQHEVLDQLLVALIAGGHVLIEGVPGLGKTLLVRSLAAAMECQFARIQFTPDLMPSDVSGHAFWDPKSESFRMRRGPVFTNLLLADEINRAPAKTQAALLEVMQEQQVTIESRSFALDPPFMTVATQNPIEQEGTYPLPEAQLDRFLLKILMHYPPHQDEVAMVTAVSQGNPVGGFDLSKVQAVVKPNEVLAMQQMLPRVTIDPVVLDYAVRLARATRDWAGVLSGAGPRGSLGLVRAARAFALLQGRDFVTPDDVRMVSPSVLRHRLTLAPELLIEGRSPDDVLKAILAKIEAPRQ